MKNFFFRSLIGNLLMLFLIIFIVLVISFIKDAYNGQFVFESRFYACPDNGNSKCYKVKINFAEGYCAEEYCDEALPNKILFDSGGSINVVCRENGKDKWNCFDKEKGNPWNLQFAETIKIKK
jgi:hypothetical protein